MQKKMHVRKHLARIFMKTTINNLNINNNTYPHIYSTRKHVRDN